VLLRGACMILAPEIWRRPVPYAIRVPRASCTRTKMIAISKLRRSGVRRPGSVNRRMYHAPVATVLPPNTDDEKLKATTVRRGPITIRTKSAHERAVRKILDTVGRWNRRAGRLA